MKFKAVIFDMDGTLINSLIYWGYLWKKFGKKYLNDESFYPSETDDKAVRTLTLADAMQMIHDNYGMGNSGEALLEEANQLAIEFYNTEVQLKDGVREFLDYCYASGTQMCIASATSPDLVDIAIKHCDIGKYFSKIFSCSDVGAGKDKPDVFLAAQEYLGSETEETWVFEDSLVALKTAKSIGMKTVGVYDAFNFGQDEMKVIADEYIADGEKLTKLVVGNLFILGDSYSTFEGWIPEGYECWYINKGRGETDVNQVEQTWWHQFIETTGANLIKNESYSGTLISHSGYNGLDYFKKSFVTRLDKLVEKGLFVENKIDTFIVFGGTNDSWANTPIGENQYSDWTKEDLYSSLPAFCYILNRAKEVAPNARIIAVVNCDLKEELVEGFRVACEKYDVENIELQGIDKREGHPTILGMKQIYEQVLEHI